MAELDQVLKDLVAPMVNDRESLDIRVTSGPKDRDVVLHVYAKSDDIARLIGRKGMMASALRQVMSIASHSEDKRVSIKLEEI